MEPNGILVQVPGEYVSRASKKLPSPELSTVIEHEAVIDVPYLGAVRIFFRRQQARHHKHAHYFWLAWRAELVAG